MSINRQVQTFIMRVVTNMVIGIIDTKNYLSSDNGDILTDDNRNKLYFEE